MSKVKLEGADELRCSSVPNNEKLPLFCCASCGGCPEVSFTCTGCRSVQYCDKKCQKANWKEHQVLCNAISQLSKERDQNVDDLCSFISHVTPKVRRQIVDLVGERCLIECMIKGLAVEGLWDTGAQVSLVCQQWLSQLDSPPDIKPLNDLVGGADISLSGAGGKKIPYLGYVWLPVLLKGRTEEIDVPFLVTASDLTNPIIGYNVIKAVAGDEVKDHEFFKDLSEVAVCEVMELLADGESDHLSHAKMVKSGHVVKKKSSSVITLKIDAVNVEKRTPVIFEPSIDAQLMFDEDLVFGEQLVVLKKGVNQRIKVSVVNTTDRDLEIPGRMVLGDINLVSSVTPVEVKMKEVADSEETQATGSVSPATGSVSPTMKEVVDSEESQATGSVSPAIGSVSPTSVDCNVMEVEHEGVENDDQYSKLKQELQDMKLDHLDPDMQVKVREMLWRKRKAFCSDDGEIGEAKDLSLKINTTDEVPVQKNYYKIPKPMIEEVKNHVRDLLDRGWIKESSSPNSSPVVLVRKKGGGLRVCCDFRELNRKTIPDKHPLPRIDDTLENLGGSRWFSVIDQTRAYYQGFVDPESRWKTAFVTPWGLYEWVRIPFGLMNAPSAFQRHMENTLREYRDQFVAPYLDDVIVFSQSLDQHITHVEKVLDKFIEKGLKIGLDKCNFFKQEVKFLGRIVNSEGYRMDEESIEAVRALRGHVPKNLGEVRQLLGLVGYHRRQIQDFAAVAYPLTQLLKTGGKDPGEKSTSKRPVIWLTEHQIALEKLIDAICTQPILAYPDYNEEFFVHTDASGYGLGCILYQIQNGEKRVIAYGSRSLLPAEKNYHSTKLEFLALKWAVCDKFRDYLGYGNTHFTIYTDNNPLLYVMQSTKLNANGQRWVSELSEFDFTVKYRPGVINRDADCLSRLPLDIEKYQILCKEKVDSDSFQALVAGVGVQMRGEESWFVNACSADVPDFPEIGSKLSLEQIRQAQEKDNVIRQVKELLEVPNKDWKNLDPKVKELLHHRKKLYVNGHGVLCRRTTNQQHEHTGTILHNVKQNQHEHTRKTLHNVKQKVNIKQEQQKTSPDQVVWPEALRHLIYQWFHMDMGHLGVSRVVQLCRSRVFWPKMTSDIEEFISQRCQCIVQKRPGRHQEAELQSISTSAPLELITVDFLKLERGVGGYQYILLVVDHFTRYVQGYATTNKSGTTAARKICTYW